MTERGLRAGSRRRVAAVIAMGALALGALSACRSEAGVAAYVGNTRFTTVEVTKASATAKSSTASHSDIEREYVSDLVYLQILRNYAAANNLKLTEPTADSLAGLATAYSTTPNDPFVVAEGRAQSYTASLAASATPVTPTDAELQPMYQRAVAANLAAPGSFASFKSSILGVDGFTNYVGLEKELAKSEASDNITINPRYAQACPTSPCNGAVYPMLPLGNGQGQQFSSVQLPLTPATEPAVIDQPAPASS